MQEVVGFIGHAALVGMSRWDNDQNFEILQFWTLQLAKKR